MITGKDFEKEINRFGAAPVHEIAFELAKRLAFEYSIFKTDYQRIESQNVNHWCRKHHNGGMISWIGADDNKIFDAYLKGEQLEASWIKELKEQRLKDSEIRESPNNNSQADNDTENSLPRRTEREQSDNINEQRNNDENDKENN